MYPEIYDLTEYHDRHCWKKQPAETSFRCKFCGAEVCAESIFSGVQNRNHCPYCLHSQHLDHAQAGDRLSACKAIMKPIGLTAKPGRNKYKGAEYGELMIIHRCSVCGKLSINRLAADDLVERLMDIFHASMRLDSVIQQKLRDSGIRMLKRDDWKLVVGQLVGLNQIKNRDAA